MFLANILVTVLLLLAGLLQAILVIATNITNDAIASFFIIYSYIVIGCDKSIPLTYSSAGCTAIQSANKSRMNPICNSNRVNFTGYTATTYYLYAGAELKSAILGTVDTSGKLTHTLSLIVLANDNAFNAFIALTGTYAYASVPYIDT